MDQHTIAGKLSEYIRNELLPEEEFDLNTPLLSAGLIDSFSLVLLHTFIRKQFGKDIPAQMMTAGNFDRIEQMASVIHGR